MKKLIVVLLTLAMLVQVFALLNVGATATDFSNNLVTHWDFEGTSPLSDKATKGSSSDTLAGKTSNSVTVADGKARVSHAIGEYMYAAGGEGTDLYSLAGKTIVMKFALDPKTAAGEDIDNTKSTSVFYKKNAAQYQFSKDATKWNDTAYDIDLRTWSGTTRITKVAGTDVGNWYGDTGYHYLVVSYDYNSSTKSLVQKFYYSESESPATSKDFSKIYEETITADSGVASAQELWLGKQDTANPASTEVIYDDIKIYDTVMTIGEVTVTLGGTDVGEETTTTTLAPDTSVSENYSDKLVTWWNFEDDGAPLADKASKGASADVLKANGNIVVSNGVGYIPDEAGAYFSASGKAGTDLNDFKDTTVVVKVAMKNNAETTRGNFTAIFSKQNGVTYGLNNEAYGNQTRMYATANGVRNMADGLWNKMNEFRVFVMTFDYDDTAKKLTVNYYMSLVEKPEKADDYMLMLNEVIDITTNDDVIESNHDVVLGRNYNGLSKQIGFFAWYDDVKVYSDVMTLDEVSAEVPAVTTYKLPDMPTYATYYEKLEGVTMYAIGDSYFEGTGIGSTKAHPTLLASKYQMNFYNDGNGGTTIANCDETCPMYNETNPPMVTRWKDNLPDYQPDIILLEGGSNDNGHSIPKGTVDSTDINTFQGAINVMITELKEEYPDALIICLTLFKNSTESKTAYANWMIEVCESRGVPYINQADPEAVGIDLTSESFRNQYSADGGESHLNFDGMKLLLPYVEEYIARYYYAYKGFEFVDQTPNQYYKANASENMFNKVSSTDATTAVTTTVAEDTTIADDTTAAATTTTAAEEQKKGCKSAAMIPVAAVVAMCASVVAVKGRRRK